MKIFTKTSCILFGALGTILLIGFVLSNFYDLQLSQAIADTNSIFGMLCASFGELLGWGMMGVFGAMAFRLAQQVEKKLFKVLLIAFGALVIGVSFYLIFADMNSSHNGFKEVSNLFVRLALAAVLETLIVLLAFKAITTKNTKALLTFWIVLMVAFYLGLAINFITKGIVMRPRYRLISEGYEGHAASELFENWYEAGRKGLAEQIYPADVVSSDDFKSFPSGHSFVSMSSLLLFYVPLLNEKAKSKVWVRYLAFAFCALYGLTIEFARIRYAAHYLSDVTFGGLLALLCAFFVPYFGFAFAQRKGFIPSESEGTEPRAE